MNISEGIVQFCSKKGLLLDKEILNIFNFLNNDFIIKEILKIINNSTSKKVITKKVLYENKDLIEKICLSLNNDGKECYEKLKISLGLSLEVSSEKFQNIPLNEEVKILEMPSVVCNKKIEVSDFVKHYRNRFEQFKKILQEHSELENLTSINKISSNKQGTSIIGIVVEKTVTKNKNILLEVEDFSGKIKVLISNSKKELVEKCEEIIPDSILGFKGVGNGEIIFANEIIFPDSYLSERKKSIKDEFVAFIGDLHFGSKRFLKNDFEKFISYINGELEDKDNALKIKYLFLVGDVITGIGNYPDQEKDLIIFDLEEQFLGLTELLSKIRKDVKIIISPGNHDGVRIMEPQPTFDETYAWPLYSMKNVTLTGNPSIVNIGSYSGFGGFNVLTYHGFSYTYYANNVSTLIKERAMNCPEKIMTFLLKHRHLAPTHSSTQFFPAEKDSLLISNIPDIFVSGHTHKSGISCYNNILIVSVSSWESMTPYQEKFGNTPDHCKVPIFNLKTRQIKILDFEIDPEGNKVVKE